MGKLYRKVRTQSRWSKHSPREFMMAVVAFTYSVPSDLKYLVLPQYSHTVFKETLPSSATNIKLPWSFDSR